MLENIIKIVFLIFCVFGITITYKNVKKIKNIYERIVYVLALFLYLTPATIYILDSYNIPTKLNFFKTVDVNWWRDFTTSYVVMIVGGILNSIILVLITYWQTKKQNESNKEDKRIQNAPIFDYALNINKREYKYNHTIEINENGKEKHLYFKLENIGLNHSKNINCLIKVDGEEDRKFTLNEHQSFIKKQEMVWIDLIFYLNIEKGHQRKITIEVYYEDMIKNKYIQRVNALINMEKTDYGIEKISVSGFNVEDATVIKEDDN